MSASLVVRIGAVSGRSHTEVGCIRCRRRVINLLAEEQLAIHSEPFKSAKFTWIKIVTSRVLCNQVFLRVINTADMKNQLISTSKTKPSFAPYRMKTTKAIDIRCRYIMDRYPQHQYKSFGAFAGSVTVGLSSKTAANEATARDLIMSLSAYAMLTLNL